MDFENNCVKLIKINPYFGLRMYARDSSFWQYKVYADIRCDSLERRRQTIVCGRNRPFFSALGVYIFGSFRNKANIIIRYYFIPHWLFNDPKTDDFD